MTYTSPHTEDHKEEHLLLCKKCRLNTLRRLLFQNHWPFIRLSRTRKWTSISPHPWFPVGWKKSSTPAQPSRTQICPGMNHSRRRLTLGDVRDSDSVGRGDSCTRCLASSRLPHTCTSSHHIVHNVMTAVYRSRSRKWQLYRSLPPLPRDWSRPARYRLCCICFYRSTEQLVGAGRLYTTLVWPLFLYTVYVMGEWLSFVLFPPTRGNSSLFSTI